MSRARIGIILSTTRVGRFADKAAAWLGGIAAGRTDMEFEIVDLRQYPMPFFDEPMSPAWAAPKNEVALRWAGKIGEFDGFIFVLAEYNHGIPAVLKNALDYAFSQFAHKPAAYVAYGSVGGARAAEQLRLVNVELQMAPVRSAVHVGGNDFRAMLLEGKTFADAPYLEPAARAMLDDLAWWVHALKAARPAPASGDATRRNAA